MKKMRKNFALLPMVLLSLTAVGCGKGMTAKSGFLNSSMSQSTPAQGIPSPDNSTPAPQQSVEFSAGFVSGGLFGGSKVVELDRVKKVMRIALPIPAANPFMVGLEKEFDLKDMPGAKLVLSSQPGANFSVALELPLRYFLGDILFVQSEGLPNGDPLPGIPGGELPKFNLNIDPSGHVKTSIYIGPAMAGIYLESPFDPYVKLMFPIASKDQKITYGYLNTVPAKAGFSGGFFLGVKIPDAISQELKGLL